MKIFVKAKPKAREEKIERIPQENSLFDKKRKNKGEEFYFVIAVKEPPIKGLANKAIIEVLARYFKVSKSEVKLLRGERSKNKIFEIS